MLCYRDMSFCADSGECATEMCPRYLSSDVFYEAGVFGLPVSVAQFKDGCKRFVPLNKVKVLEESGV